MRIVQALDFREEPGPLLVMPYFRLGNLENQHQDSPIAADETIEVLSQCLEALEYLHHRGVVHRDIKPSNILVESRDPLSVKLADFGLAQVAAPGLETVRGTFPYVTPEIYYGEDYSPAVDLWSLGVVGLELTYGIEKQKSNKSNGTRKSDRTMTRKMGLS